MIKNFVFHKNSGCFIRTPILFLLLISFLTILVGCASDDVIESPYYMQQPSNGDDQYSQQYGGYGQNPYTNPAQQQGQRRDSYYYTAPPQSQQNQSYNPYQTPASRYYSNPYAMPPQNYYPYYDGDQYYAPPAYYGSPDYYKPSNKANNSDISKFNQ